MSNTRLKRTPLYEQHVAAGGRMVPFAGFEMPVQYTSIRSEHQAVRERVGIFDVSHMGEIELLGDHAVAVADTIFTNGIARLANGQACYTCMCRPDGGIIDDLVVYKITNNHVLICANAANHQKDLAHIKSIAANRCEVRDTSDEWVQIAVQGPCAASVIDGLIADFSTTAIKRFRFTHAQVCGTKGIVSRTGYTGEDGFELYMPTSSGTVLWDALLKTGADVGIQPAGLGARDSLRLEVAFPLYGNDIDETTTPYEAGLGWVVQLNKPEPFVGQQVLELEKQRTPQRRLVGIEVTGRGIARADYQVFSSDGRTAIGRVTSGTHSPSLGKAIALAYVQAPYTTPGTDLAISIRDQLVPAVVVPCPFLKKPASS
ncbi:MAG: glycine cleavage system aminomethyltransferase GcvT [Myxococcales bacterium]|nr:glycine cleavage system aminomethyltransferase GcvT [Myxococcales bacterium]